MPMKMDALTDRVGQAAMEALVKPWFGVSKAEYSVQDEAPVVLVEFCRSRMAAMLIWWNRHNGDARAEVSRRNLYDSLISSRFKI
jgi:hypothetical protein